MAHIFPVSSSSLPQAQSGVYDESSEYFIVAMHSGHALDVDGASLNSDAKVQQWEKHGGDNQRFRLRPVQGQSGVYFIHPVHSQQAGMCIGLQNTHRQDNGANLVQERFTGSMDQMWRISDLNGGPSTLVNLQSNKYVNVSGKSRQNGGRVQQWDLLPGDNFKFRLERFCGKGWMANAQPIPSYQPNPTFPSYHDDNAEYFIASVHSGLYLDIDGASVSAGAKVHQWSRHGGENQRFRLRAVPGQQGVFAILPVHSQQAGMCVGLEGSGQRYDNGARLVQEQFTGSPDQLWRIADLKGGATVITNVQSNKGMNVFQQSRDNGAQMVQWDLGHGEHFQFRLERHMGQGHTATAQTYPSLPAFHDDNQEYFIASSHSGLYLDIDGASVSAGAKVHQWSRHGGDNQRFRLRSVPGQQGVFAILPVHSQQAGMCVGLEGAQRFDNGARLVQEQFTGAPDQLWRIADLNGGATAIINVQSNKCMNVYGESKENGVQIVQWDLGHGEHMKFRLERHGSKFPVPQAHMFPTPSPFHNEHQEYFLTACHSGLVLDVDGAAHHAGAKLSQYGRHAGANQRFKLRQVAPSTYAIFAAHSGKCVAVDGASKDNMAAICQQDYAGQPHQHWRISDLNGGFIQVINCASNKAMDISGGSTTQGAGVVQYDLHGGNNQKFSFTKAN